MDVAAVSAMTLTQRAGHALASLIGWDVTVQEPIPAKCIIVGAHHTASFDFVLAFLCRMATGVSFNFVAKSSLFRGVMGWPVRRLGGIPVDRAATKDFVAQIVDAFERHDTLRIGISPEGTRGQTTFWRTGFYYMAQGAGVPIVLAFADYRRKVVGFGPVIIPSGDLEADLEVIRRFYADVTARHPEKQGEVRLRLPDL